MKNFKKGFIWLVILMVVIIFLAVVGVLYYMGQNSSLSSTNFIKDFFPQENKIINNTQADCLPTTTPWIKVISPNGGEVFQTGQQILVKWETCNISKEAQVFAQLAQGTGQGEYSEGPGGIEGIAYYSPNDGNENINLLSSMFGGDGFSYRNNFRIQITTTLNNNVFDYSDNFFTINSNNINTDPFGRYVGKGCKIINGCNGPIGCVNENADIGGSTCNYLPEYSCYKVSTARCEKQTSGNCDWTNTSELKNCIEKARKQ